MSLGGDASRFWALRLAASLVDVAGSYLAGCPHIASRARQPQGH